MPDPPCIFCFNSTDFTREHVIPDAIGGSLFLDDTVCKACNSWLGANVDAELVKLPETIDAFEALGIPYDRDTMLNRHYEAVGSARDVEIQGRLTGDGFRFHPQALADGSIVFPEDQAWAALRKSVLREGAATEEQVDAELARLQEAYDASSPNEPIQSALFGRTVVRRSDALDVELKPRSTARIAPAMAKIAYELLFLIAGGKRLFSPENEPALTVLADLINDRSTDGVERCIRLAPLTRGFDDAHWIRFERGTANCRFRVILFGNIHHYLVIPSLTADILEGVAAAAKQSVRGVDYLQRVTTGDKAFRAITPDGKAIFLPSE